LRGIDAQPHVVAVAVGVLEPGHHLAGDQAANDRRYRAEVEPEVAGGLAVHGDAHLGPRLILAGIDVGGARHLPQARHHLLTQFTQTRQVAAANRHLDRFGGFAASTCRAGSTARPFRWLRLRASSPAPPRRISAGWI
jgi:hypothetical protein